MRSPQNEQLLNRRWRAELIKKRGSNRLYIKLIYHRKEPYVRSTGLKDDPENRALVESIVAAMNADLRDGTFAFARAFPGASEEDKRFFSSKEHRKYTASPGEVTLKEAYEVWKYERFAKIPSKTTREDYMKAINPHILPYFGDMTFDEIDEEAVQGFFSTRYLYGDPDNGLVSKKRMLNIKIPLVDIWEYTVRRRKWDLDSPFTEINEYIDQITTRLAIELTSNSVTDPELLEVMLRREQQKQQQNSREVILFSDYRKALDHVDRHYRPVIELMLLTGMSSSEIAGLHVKSRDRGLLSIQWSLSDMNLRDFQKTKTRTREIPLTKAINRVLDEAMERKKPESIFIFLTKTGLPLYDRPIREAWDRACHLAGIKRVVPYALRHTFVAYCELMGIDRPRIIGLMGHQDKSMIDRIYGKYVNRLERDLDAIKEYFGEDFWGR